MSRILILNIETSASHCSVTLGNNGLVSSSAESKGDWKHSKEITLLIEGLLKETQIQFDDLNAVAVSAGPGSYTGLRVGTSAAKAICYALDIPLIAVETLKMMAAEFAGEVRRSGGYIIPFIDARRDEVYYQVYDDKLNALTDADNLILEAKSLHEYAGTRTIICGDGAEKAKNILGDGDFIFHNSHPHARFMSALSFSYYINNNFSDTAYFTPFYLKSPNITRSKKPLF